MERLNNFKILSTTLIIGLVPQAENSNDSRVELASIIQSPRDGSIAGELLYAFIHNACSRPVSVSRRSRAVGRESAERDYVSRQAHKPLILKLWKTRHHIKSLCYGGQFNLCYTHPTLRGSGVHSNVIYDIPSPMHVSISHVY